MIACYHCGALDCTEENYCFGCKEYVCEDCDLSPSLMGYHLPEAHLDLEYEEEEESDSDELDLSKDE